MSARRGALVVSLISCYKRSSGRQAIVKLCVLASGSSGNAAFVATERTRLLVDVGLSMKDLFQRLDSIRESPEALNALVITHEHSDHIAGLPRVAKRLNIPVYITPLTAPAVDWNGYAPKLEHFQAGACFCVGDIEIQSFTLPHDALDPVGFCLRAQGIRIGIVTDLGYITDSIKFHLRGTDLLLLESNHDIEMLKVGPYPWSVKQRVMSRMGHLSNNMVCEFLLEDFDGSTSKLILGHLSEHNNHPEIVRISASQALERRQLRTELVVAQQKYPTEVFML